VYADIALFAESGEGALILPHKEKLPCAPSIPEGPGFKFCLGSPELPRRKAVKTVFKTLGSVQHFETGFRVILYIGDKVEIASRSEPRDENIDKIGPDKPALVMALFGPGIGVEDIDAGERARLNALFEELYRVVVDNTDIPDAVFFEEAHELADSGRMNFNAEKIHVGEGRGYLPGSRAHAKSDFGHKWNLPSLLCAGSGSMRGD